jgi:choline dehydrogenase-like flavoprotein
VSRKLRIAIIGGGAAAVGVLSGLAGESADLDVTVLDLPPSSRSPHEITSAPGFDPEDPAWAVTPALVRYARSRLGWRFPPPKSHFGIAPATVTVEDWGEIWQSTAEGGLTRYWGGSALPYPDDEFVGWPFSASEIRPHYEAIVRMVPVSGAEDSLSRLWSGGLASRPVLARCGIFERFIEHVERNSDASYGYEFLAGSGRVAVETAPTSEERCRLAGRCMIGCPHGAIFTAATLMRAYRKAGLVNTAIHGEVRSFDPGRRTLRVVAHQQTTEVGPFDLIFIAAGCLGSTAIVLRSMSGITGVQLQDNSVYSFPLIYFGSSGARPKDTRYFGLTNAVIACRPVTGGGISVIQLYPLFDYLWQYYLPPLLWKIAGAVAATARDHVAIARLYLPAEHSQRYSIALDSRGDPKLALARAPTPLEEIPDLWNAIRTGLSGNGFWVPRVLRSQQRTSSHYAGTLPAGAEYCTSRGEVADHVYLCDSAAFPASSAFSPTLTIMAVARKRTREAIERVRTSGHL